MSGLAPRVALLRGVNLGPQRRVSMAELRALASGLGWTGVATHLQSGNLVFQAPGSDADVAGQLGAALNQRFGLHIDVVIRDQERLRTLLEAHPYAGGDPSRVMVACGDRPIEAAALDRLGRLRRGDEQFALAASGQDLYASFPDGQARSRLAAGLIEALSPALATARNLRTMSTLVDLLRAEPAR